MAEPREPEVERRAPQLVCQSRAVLGIARLGAGDQRSDQRLPLGAKHRHDVVDHGAAQGFLLRAQEVAIHPLGVGHGYGVGCRG